MPRLDAGARDRTLLRRVGHLRVGGGCPPKMTRLRRMLGGRDQLGDKVRPRPLQVRHARPLCNWRYRHQRNAARPSVRDAIISVCDAVVCRLPGSTGT